MPWTSTTDAVIWSPARTREPRIILVREGKFHGLWTAVPFDHDRLPRELRVALERLAGRRANEWHAAHGHDSTTPDLLIPHPQHSPSQLHWNQLLMLVIAGHAEVLG